MEHALFLPILGTIIPIGSHLFQRDLFKHQADWLQVLPQATQAGHAPAQGGSEGGNVENLVDDQPMKAGEATIYDAADVDKS